MSYARFYALLKRLPVHSDEMKEELVLQYTGQRTSSLRDMTEAEYNTMCNALESSFKDSWSVKREQLKKSRSAVLHLMQRLGIDTSDWVRINAFCRDSRIAGKEFAALDCEELDKLLPKLRSIQRNGGLKPFTPKQEPPLEKSEQHFMYVPIGGLPN